MIFHRGDIIKVNFNPVSGHEQGFFRPALVMNDIPIPGNLNIVFPITTKEKSYPLEVELDDRTISKGVILCFQPRALDLIARNAKFIEKAPDDIVETCYDYIKRLLEKVDLPETEEKDSEETDEDPAVTGTNNKDKNE